MSLLPIAGSHSLKVIKVDKSVALQTVSCRRLKLSDLCCGRSTYRATFASRTFSSKTQLAMPFAKIHGKELHYSDYAPVEPSTTPTTIIFAHGLGSTQNYYQTVLPYLSKYRCITFDNYGAGRSKYYADLIPETSIEGIGNDVLGLLDYLKLDKAVVVGFSMGGMVPTTMAAAEHGRSRVIAGICIGPVHPSPAGAETFKKRIVAVREGGMETMADTIPSAATGPSTTSLQKAFIREMLLAQDPEGYCANCRAIENAKPPAYSQVTCPILIIAGEVDKSAPLDGCKLIYNELSSKNKKLEVLSGRGHWLCVEDGDKVGQLIQDFVESL